MAKETFDAAIKIIEDAKSNLDIVLADPIHSSTKLMVDHQLDVMVNRFHFLGGSAPKAAPSVEFPPITNMLGEDISKPTPVTQADITPTLTDKEIFQEKVKALASVLPDMETDLVLVNHTIPEDILVLRRVAKEAGVEDYKQPLTVMFVDEIKAKLIAKATADETAKTFDESLKKGKGGKKRDPNAATADETAKTGTEETPPAP